MTRPSYSPRQTWLSDMTERCLDPGFVRAVQAGTHEALEALVTRLHPGVIEFPLLSAEYREALLREIHAFEHWCRHRGVGPVRPNSMNNQGVVLAELGLEGAMDELLYTWLSPLTKWAFPEHAGSSVDHQHSFVVEYAENGDTDLGFHVDDSEVTLNACLGLSFDGAEVYFRGVRCDAHREDPANDAEVWQWNPAAGRAILHAGAHRHGVHALRSGRRVNLIVWARSSRHRRAHRAPHEGPTTWCPRCEAA
ncbi:hypothetical protein [Polyangium sp. 15x6]|uniref:hypothetical protein n=1 Tax=Polyangium sp. 15x6 TaxID=3042687 RepID=UPI00249A51B3|nr:hypothetical protein [Polyangium sp. 15x6]MDI3285835.1 hypothetical protein [Polyangium sp. 15x6]